MKALAFAVLLPGVASALHAAVVPPKPETDFSHDGWYAEFPPALAEAKRLGRDMLIDFGGSDWCAPCKWLKEHILTKPGFNEKASSHFVLVDIDTLARGLSPERKARYVALQKRYRVGTFPSVFLTTPDGEPYAWTTYIPATNDNSYQAMKAAAEQDTPERFWNQIEPLIERGRKFRDGLARARGLAGVARADALIDALSEVRADFLLWYHADKVAELRKLDPSDHRGFLAYLDGCQAYANLEARIGGGYKLNPDVTVADVDDLIAKQRLSGETLQQALAMKATLLVIGRKPAEALACIGAFADAQATRGPYDRGDAMPIDDDGLQALRRTVREGLAQPGNTAAEYLALHRIFENQELPNRYRISCHATEGSAFEPIIAVREPICDGYGNALLAGTASMQGEERARALCKGLEGTFMLNSGAIRTIVTKTVPDLVGAENAAAFLPEPYKRWVPAKPRAKASASD